MERASAVIRGIAGATDRAILFHSASGKDSIALLDLMAPHFKEVVCVFMYVVPGMEHLGRYISWSCRQYPCARFVQVPHYSLCSYIRSGFFGCRCAPSQKRWTLESLTDEVRRRTGIGWAFYGFKQSDSMNRRLMLRGYRDAAVCDSTMKAYPLSTYRNSDVLRYIADRHLMAPERYGGERQSSGEDITDIHYLLWLRANWPGDLRRVYAAFPMAERLVFEHDSRK